MSETPKGPAATPGSTPPEPAPVSNRRTMTFAIIAGAIVLAFGVWLVVAKLPGWLTEPRNGVPVESTPAASTTPTGGRRIRVSLFYVSDTGLELQSIGREIPYGATPSEQARHIIEAQIQAAPPGQVSAIPPDTTLRGVYLAPQGQAFVDFGPEIAANHSGGSLDEALTVYAIVNALCTNLASDVTSVQILVDGKQVDTLAGHVDLRRPLSKSLDWVAKGR